MAKKRTTRRSISVRGENYAKAQKIIGTQKWEGVSLSALIDTMIAAEFESLGLEITKEEIRAAYVKPAPPQIPDGVGGVFTF